MFLAPFVASPLPVVRHMLTLAKISPGEIVYDLGCGDGRVAIMAAQEFGASAVGVELREDLVKKALTKISELDLEGRVEILQQSIFDVDISPADIVFLYLTTTANSKVKPKLEVELRKKARIISHDYEVLGWKPFTIDKFCENPKRGYPSHTIYLYKMDK